MNLSRSIIRPIVGGFGGGVRGMRRLSVAAFDALKEYDDDTIYRVDGLGVFHGTEIIEREAWAPAAGDLYVATTGNDANAGTDPAHPKLTIVSAFNTIAATGGKTIWVAAGTYAENSGVGYINFVSKFFTNPVVIRSVPGDAVTISPVSGAYCVSLNNCSNIKFREVNFTQGTTGIVVNPGGTACTDCGFFDCTFTDSVGRTTSIWIVGTTGTERFQVKRCTITSPSTGNITLSSQGNCEIVGNHMIGTNAGAIGVTTAAYGGRYWINSNKTDGPITFTGGTGVTLVAQVRRNVCRNITHTGGTSTYQSVLNIERNTIDSLAFAGLDVRGFTVGGKFANNDVTSNGVHGIAWPFEAALGTGKCTGHQIVGNNIINTGGSGHAILVGPDGEDAIIRHNVLDARNGGAYGMVMKGKGCIVENNSIYAGSIFGLLIKGGRECEFRNNTIYGGTNAATLASLVFGLEDATAPNNFLPTDNVVTDNTFVITNNRLYNLITVGTIGAGNLVDRNNYQLSGSGTWGVLFGTTVNSLADVRAQWAANYPTSPTNDANSVAV